MDILKNKARQFHDEPFKLTYEIYHNSKWEERDIDLSCIEEKELEKGKVVKVYPSKWA